MKAGNREPDFVLNNVGGPVDKKRNPQKSLLIGEIKMSIRTFRSTYRPSKREGQYKAIVRYAARNTYPHIALLIALRDGSQKVKENLLKQGFRLDKKSIPVIVAIQ
jgi:hypothetical protein